MRFPSLLPSSTPLPPSLPTSLGPPQQDFQKIILRRLRILFLVIALIAVSALRGLEVGKWIHNAGAIAILLVYAGLILLPLWALWRHVPVHWIPFPVALPPPTLRSLALFGQMIFGALCGLEYIAILAGKASMLLAASDSRYGFPRR